MKAKINGTHIGYDDIGRGPAIVLIHAFPLDRSIWDFQAGPLVQAGFRVVTIDLRGFGESELGQARPAMETYADDVIGLLNYLGIGRAVICGLSMGGYVLFNLLERYPQRLAGACFVATRAVIDDIQERYVRDQLGRDFQRGDRQRLASAYLDVMFSSRGKRRQAVEARLLRKKIEDTDPEALMSALEALRARKDYTSLLPRIEVPTLIVGAEHDLAIHPRHVDLMASGLQRCVKSIIRDAGHLVNMEKPGDFNVLLIGFLNGFIPDRLRRASCLQEVA